MTTMKKPTPRVVVATRPNEVQPTNGTTMEPRNRRRAADVVAPRVLRTGPNRIANESALNANAIENEIEIETENARRKRNAKGRRGVRPDPNAERAEISTMRPSPRVQLPALAAHASQAANARRPRIKMATNTVTLHHPRAAQVAGRALHAKNADE